MATEMLYSQRGALDVVNQSHKENKLGAVIFLRRAEQPKAEDVKADFVRRWPKVPLLYEGKDECCLYIGVKDRPVCVELRSTPAPQSLTDYVVSGSMHWPEAGSKLAGHRAHLAVATSLENAVPLDLAGNFTRLLVSLSSLNDSIGVCWLNGPVLHSAKSFIGIGMEMLSANLLPLPLWVGAYWRPDERAIVSSGMAQFGFPEIQMEHSSKPSPEIIEYLYRLADYVLMSRKEIFDGETIDGPQGTFSIRFGSGIVKGRTALILEKVRPN